MSNTNPEGNLLRGSVNDIVYTTFPFRIQMVMAKNGDINSSKPLIKLFLIRPFYISLAEENKPSY